MMFLFDELLAKCLEFYTPKNNIDYLEKRLVSNQWNSVLICELHFLILHFVWACKRKVDPIERSNFVKSILQQLHDRYSKTYPLHTTLFWYRYLEVQYKSLKPKQFTSHDWLQKVMHPSTISTVKWSEQELKYIFQLLYLYDWGFLKDRFAFYVTSNPLLAQSSQLLKELVYMEEVSSVNIVSKIQNDPLHFLQKIHYFLIVQNNSATMAAILKVIFENCLYQLPLPDYLPVYVVCLKTFGFINNMQLIQPYLEDFTIMLEYCLLSDSYWDLIPSKLKENAEFCRQIIIVHPSFYYQCLESIQMDINVLLAFIAHNKYRMKEALQRIEDREVIIKIILELPRRDCAHIYSYLSEEFQDDVEIALLCIQRHPLNLRYVEKGSVELKQHPLIQQLLQ